MTPQKFRNLVWAYHRLNGRHDLPWRATHDPYRVLVSEVMLQQTQVERVIPFYTEWIQKFPNAKALAKVPLSDVLKTWQGLGYNRRAKALHEAAKEITKLGAFPKTAEELEKLPGIGPYTAQAVMAFAYNKEVIFIETNIRTAITHHFFPAKEKVEDKEILEILIKAFPKGKAREWYGALMDYGSALKKSGIRINAKAKGYTKQSSFEGSSRQARGAILRTLVGGPLGAKKLISVLGKDREQQMVAQLSRLYREGLVERVGSKYRLPT